MAKDDLVDALTALKKVEGRRVLLTLAFEDMLLARTDMQLEDILVEGDRIILSGSFEELDDKILHREVALPMAEDEGLTVAAFGGELRLTTSEGFFLEVVPLA